MAHQNVPQKPWQHLFQVTDIEDATPVSTKSPPEDVMKELAVLQGKIAAIEKLLEIDLSRSMVAFQ